MQLRIILCIFTLLTLTAIAQETKMTDGKPAQTKTASTGTEANPVMTTIRGRFDRQAKNIIAAAESMPAENFSFKPTEGQISFGRIVAHIAESNVNLCSRLGSGEAPQEKVAETDPKDKLIAAMKKSFDFCGSQLAKLEDAQLGEIFTVGSSGRKVSKAATAISLPVDWADHYSQMAMYLRLKNILPPTAQPRQ